MSIRDNGGKVVVAYSTVRSLVINVDIIFDINKLFYFTKIEDVKSKSN